MPKANSVEIFSISDSNADDQWIWRFSLTSNGKNEYSLEAQQEIEFSLLNSNGHILEPILGIRTGDELYSAIRDALFKVGYDTSDKSSRCTVLSLSAVAKSVSQLDKKLAADFRKAPAKQERAIRTKASESISTREKALAPYYKPLNAYLEKYEKSRRYDESSRSGLSSIALRKYIEDRLVKTGTLPMGEARIPSIGPNGRHTFYPHLFDWNDIDTGNC